MLEMDSKIKKTFGYNFKEYRTVHDLERRLAQEDRQLEFWPELEMA